MSNPYKTKEFRQLRSTWYKKLAEGGFFDFEMHVNARNHVVARPKSRKIPRKRNYLGIISEKKTRRDKQYLLRTHSHTPIEEYWCDYNNPHDLATLNETQLTHRLDILSWYLHALPKINGPERLVLWYFYHGLNIYQISARLQEFMPMTQSNPNDLRTRRNYGKSWVLTIIEKHLRIATTLYRIENEEDY